MTEFIDLFCGAGGLSIGLEGAGFKCSAAVEINRDACETFVIRHPGAFVYDHSIERINFSKYRDIPLLAGGPPCQPFSAGGNGLAFADARNMIPEFVRAVREARPVSFLMENVPGLISPSHRDYLQSVIIELNQLGYTIATEVLNAANYGVPQKRRRLLVVGVRRGMLPFEFPVPTHGDPASNPFVSAGSVISAVVPADEANESTITYAKRPDMRPSPYDGHLFNGGGRAINLDTPCPTILASAGGNKTHFVDQMQEVPTYHQHLQRGGAPRVGTLPGGRRLTVRESAQMQTFPQDMRFHGSRSSQYAQVGNAVPPLLAQALGIELLATLRRSSASR